MDTKETLQTKILHRIELIKLAKSQVDSAKDADERKHWEGVIADLDREKFEFLGKIQALSSQLEVKA